MEHSSSARSGSSARSAAPRVRVAVFAPVLIATLSLVGLARAQDSSWDPAPDNASPQPSQPPPPVASPSQSATAGQQSATAGQQSATTASEAPAARPAEPSPQVAPVAPASDVRPASSSSTTPASQAKVAPASDVRPLPLATRVHQGFYLRLTSGPSFLSLRGHGPLGTSASITDSGPSGSLAIGGAVVPGLVLAGIMQGAAFNAEFEGGPFTDATVTVHGRTRSASANASGGFGMVGVLVDWYPRPTANWHAGFSTGLGVVGLTNAADDSDLGGVNFSGSVFGGYDWSLGRKWSLGLQLVASGGTSSKLQRDLESDNPRDSGYRLAPFSFGVQGSLLYF